MIVQTLSNLVMQSGTDMAYGFKFYYQAKIEGQIPLVALLSNGLGRSAAGAIWKKMSYVSLQQSTTLGEG